LGNDRKDSREGESFWKNFRERKERIRQLGFYREKGRVNINLYNNNNNNNNNEKLIDDARGCVGVVKEV
jgi:hypothetical protein